MCSFLTKKMADCYFKTIKFSRLWDDRTAFDIKSLNKTVLALLIVLWLDPLGLWFLICPPT